MIKEDDLFRTSDYSLRRLVGGDVATVPIVFSSDNIRAFIVAGKDVIVVNVSTGRWERVLTHTLSDNEDQTVVGVHFEVPNKLITYTATRLRSEWDVQNGAVISTCDIAVDKEICLSHRCADHSDLIVCKLVDKLDVFTYRDSSTEPLRTTGVHDVSSVRQLALTDDFLVVCDKRCVFLYLFDDGSVKKFTYTGKMQSCTEEQSYFTVAAACGDTIAASMRLGRVFMWDNVSKVDIRSPTRTVHWHQMAPSLVVTPMGSMVSGGHEATLVKYSLNKTKDVMSPSFLPHLQANVLMLSLSEDGSLLSMVLQDNSVHFVLLSTMTVLCSPQIVLTRHETLPRSLLPLTADPFHPDAVVVSALPGLLHWIDANNGFAFEKVEVTGENAFSATNKGKLVAYSDIVSATFTMDLAVTSTSRIGAIIPSNWLKFWSRAPEAGTLHLEYECDCGEKMISLLRATADSDSVLTVDSEGQLSCWERRDEDRHKWSQGKPVAFQKTGVSYASQFSGALIALIHDLEPQKLRDENTDDDREGVLVVWDITKDRTPSVMQCYCGDGKFVSAEWDPSPGSRTLFLTSATFVCGFDVYSASLIWMINNLPCCPRTGVTSDFFYFFLDDGVYVFKEANKELSGMVKFERPDFRAYGAVGINHRANFKIVFAMDKGYMVLSKKTTDCFTRDKSEQPRKTAFARLLSSGQREVPKRHLPQETKSAIEMLSGPIHALAPIPLLSARFVQSCLAPPKET